MKVQCKFNDQSWYSGDQRTLYTCTVKNVSIKERETEISSFIGEHLTNRTNKDVTAIKFTLETVHFFPRGLHKIFPKLKYLQIYECGLREVSREDLNGLSNLEDLNLEQNELRSLPSDLFVGMTKLKEISFENNKLSFVSSDLFAPIAENELRYVSFGNNTKIDAVYWPENEEKVGSLQELMDIIDEKCETPKDVKKEMFMNIIAVGLKELWISKDFADFTIICGGELKPAKELKVHKNILATHSEVFARMLTNEMKESQEGKMTIEDFSAETVEAMLEFMYTGEVQEMNAMDLFAVAAKYEVKLLQTVAEKIIMLNINDTNAIEVFGLGHLHRSESIKRAAYNKIKELFPDTPFSDKSMEQPESLKEIVKVHREYIRKVKRKGKTTTLFVVFINFHHFYRTKCLQLILMSTLLSFMWMFLQ